MDDVDDGRYFEDYTVVGELECLVKKLSSMPTGFVFRDVAIKLCSLEASRHKLLDSLDHYSFQSDDENDIPMLFNLSSEHICAQIDHSHDHQGQSLSLSIGPAKFILSAMTLAFPNLPCFVRFGRHSQYIIGKRTNTLFSFIPDSLEGNVEKRCSAMIVLYLRVPKSSEWQRTMMTEKEGIQFPICPFNLPVQEYQLKGIFPQADSSKSLKEELDALMAPILLLSAHGSNEIVSQSEVFLTRLADLHDCVDQPLEYGINDFDLHAKTKLRQIACPTNSHLFTLYLKYIFEGNGERICIKLFKCIMSCLYDNSTSMKQCIPFIAGLWMEFAKQLRTFWEDRTALSNVAEQPDWDEALVFQKLSLLQYCLLNAEDACNTVEPLEDPSEHSMDKTRLGVKHSSEMFMQNFPDRPIMIPITQSSNASTVMTSDQFAHYQSIMQKYPLEERNRLHAIPLLSDMQAFKAANPGCTLTDFLRWHSPKDIIEGDPGDKQPELSERMKKGVWMELWEEAEPIPAALQPALFSPWKEAEKALFYIEDLSVAELLDQCILAFPTIFNIEQEHRLIKKSFLVRQFDNAELIAEEGERDRVQNYFLKHLSCVHVGAQYFAFPDTKRMLVKKDGKDWIARCEHHHHRHEDSNKT